ncbi:MULTISPECIES: molybdenum cofactor guanylyltransferase MobA [unclassified Chelatococcus]|uniref:molybdenum cofactor guanylyltransferase MobA n=1 Tax=unclassified Chelatococcus TaxID=2638111 RepID=UPI001BCF1886|nr:molybdenum cofactor guanylyltransferase MobA [Chelatococcus sp.]MBS7739152.1 molybdenum cofactor guanylyltransferase MobA [Chelatococcus sp. HY11]CAH1670830.1 Molybdenum cofactor guanylyltransferase [Hyphomicrobiales bacterium]MBX3543642.1 molybdenum cofactor guanylyltransferase MobA [Chelatococcus sp.]MCO5076316.1 molybdenum cofactor guanylyltransferase MobA [Chelatococcus sp.]CAH1676968.1 Molybdenum cofactor guanylyltransferase [Hyphomicrobiales bacterium]
MAGVSETLPTAGLVLAGGRSRRMGTDKAQLVVAGKPLLAHVLERLAPQCAVVAVNAGDDVAQATGFGYDIVKDTVPGQIGPLAGVLAGLSWCASNHPDAAWMVSSTVDTPFLPHDLVTRLHEARARAGADIACAASHGRSHHATALWPVALVPALHDALTLEGIRAVAAFTDRYRIAVVEWPSVPVDPFFNVNTPADRDEAERLAGLAG